MCKERVAVALQGSQVESRLLPVQRGSGVAEIQGAHRQVFLLLRWKLCKYNFGGVFGHNLRLEFSTFVFAFLHNVIHEQT